MNDSIRKKGYLLLGLLILPFWGFAQQIEVKGCIVEESGNALTPVSYVNIALMGNDSTLVKGEVSDEKGNFSMKGIKNGDYILSASFVGYEKVFVELKNLSNSIDLGNIRILPSSVSLNEVTVSASQYVNQIDRKIIFPDDQQIKKAANGMDLLRNLQLSGLDINRMDNTIKGARGGRAEIRINGKKVNEKEILAISPADVIRIEYHDEPSLRYEGSEVVIDYILRRRETGGSVMLYGQKGMPGDKTDAYSVIKLNYKKSEFSISGGVNHTNYDDTYRTNREVFNFQDSKHITRIEEGLPERKRNDVSSIMAGYSFLEPDKHHLSVNIGYNQYNPVNKSKGFLYKEGDENSKILLTDYNRANNKQPFANLYYQLNLKNRQMLVFDALAGYYNTDIRRNYEETRQEETLTKIASYIRGKRFTLIGEGFYEKSFEAGRFNIGAKHTQIFQKNRYTGNTVSKTDIDQGITYFYAEWMGRIKKFSYSAGIGGTHIHIRQEETKSDDLRFTPTLRLAYQFNNQIQIRYTGQVGTQAPGTGYMDPTEQAIDSLRFQRGNPHLKSVSYFVNTLTLSYDTKPFSANLQVYDHYTLDPIMESIFEKDGKFIQMMENHKGLHQVTTTGYAKVSLLNGNLNMNVRGGLNWIKSWGDKYDHILDNWFISGGIDYTWKKWNPFWNISSRRNNLSGETIHYSEQSSYFGVRYKLKNLWMSAFYKYSIGWDSGRDNLNKFASAHVRNYSPDSKNMFLIDFVLNLNFGRKYGSKQKRVSNSGGGSGTMNIDR